MSTSLVLTREAFEKLLRNLVDLEEGYQKIVNDYYPHHTQDHISIIELLKDYIDKLNTSLKNVTFKEVCENCFPYVIIGSVVEILDINYGETCKYYPTILRGLLKLHFITENLWSVQMLTGR